MVVIDVAQPIVPLDVYSPEAAVLPSILFQVCQSLNGGMANSVAGNYPRTAIHAVKRLWYWTQNATGVP